MAIVTYNDNGTIKVVKFGNYVVSTDADPIVQKYWVFLHGSAVSEGTTYEHRGIMDEEYASQGCTAPSTLGTYLNSQSNPSGLAIGTRASVKMNALGGSTCDTWAIFEVQAV